MIFLRNQRVQMTKAGLKQGLRSRFNKTGRGTVVADSIDAFVRIRQDGLRVAATYSPMFWQPIGICVACRQQLRPCSPERATLRPPRSEK